MKVRDITNEILASEGGFVNDPDDPGGATNYGVTIGTMRRLGLDLDGDGDVDVRDVRILSRDKAAEIFERDYFHKAKIPMLPEVLQASVYDMNVNAGSNAVKILQRLLRELDEPVGVDGAIGPQTAGAAHRAADRVGDVIADAYGIARRNYYYRLGDSRPRLRKFARRRDGGKGGWILRAEKFVSPEYHLSAAEHARRVAKWG
ncbi:holin-associated N-acetylmuramidase [Roseovarius sp. C03]|uniref:holin-associated N-acetylmuramidase n=1 Tax=Roseovarius sp. C03 TaxID=3449222 RepID=UPI003EDC5A79